MKKLAYLFLGAALLLFNEVRAQTTGTDTSTQHFILRAGIDGLQEVVSGRLAAQKAVSPDVKAFGSRMVTDHQKEQDKLMQLAKAKGYQIPPEALKATPDIMLKNATGKNFD
jgi:putative membrane protein